MHERTRIAMNNTHPIITKGFATAAGEGERIWFVADTLTLKATAASTGRSFTVIECLLPLAAGLPRARHWFDSARVPGPRARVPRNVPPSYPSFVFGLLSPLQNASLPRQGLARAANDPAGANGESRGAAPGRWAASPLRTTGRLRPCTP